MNSNNRQQPFLEGIKTKKNPFKTPENYFNNISEENLLQKNSLPKASGFIVDKHYFETFNVQQPSSIIKQLIPYISIAAAIVISFFLFGTEDKFEELNNSEVINYLALEEEIDLIDIIDYSTEEQLLLTDSNLELLNPTIDELSLELSEFDIINF